MKTLLFIISLLFGLSASAETITDFNSPLWNYGTGNGADASGSGVVAGVPFTIDFSLNDGTKLFTEPPLVKTNQHTSNATIGHGGPAGALLLGGSAGIGEGLTLTFASPVTVVLGLTHVNISSDGWDFVTPADEIVSLHADHEIVGVVTSINGLRQNSALGAVATATNNISYFRWNNVTVIDIQTFGFPSTTLGLASMNVTNLSASVPSLSTWGVLLLIGILGVVGLQRTRIDHL